MSTAKENPCRKFQANIFNKSKCQNCFKPRELHLLTDQDLTQAKPIYGGWLCLAPEGTDFDNPMQRSRKWQRRFFVLYEHGCLRFALDESRSTLPQGTVNMNLCTDVIDAEPKTGQKNALCIITPEQEYFIRGENKEIINGWSEQLVVYPKTNKQNQKKKRKVEPATTLEPGPAKVAVTGSGIPEADPGPDSRATVWSAADLSPLGALPSPAGLEGKPPFFFIATLFYRSGVIEKLEALELENAEKMEVEETEVGRSAARQGRHENRRFHRQVGGCCQKYWFVLTDHSLRYYKDSIAEEASDLDGEIELATCYNVTEYQAQRNYGFQIHTLEGVHTLSAMTAGIRRNWIQAVMKNVRPSPAPDVARSVTRITHKQLDLQWMLSCRAAERRREGRSKTFDWAEFRPIAQALAQQRAQEAEGLSADMADVERSRRREERRKRYDAATAPPEAAPSGGEGGRMDCEGGAGAAVHAEVVAAAAAPAERKQRVEEVIEQHWQQVEQTPLREEKRVPLPVALQPRDTAELERLLESYKRGVRPPQTSSHVATCERGFAAMEDSHQRVVDELQRKHQRELENLQEEKDRLLAEETAATIAAIEAMRNAHRSELEKELEKARKTNNHAENADLDEIHRQHEEELCSFQREIEVLSEQYSQKCLENAHLAQALEAERQALRQCQRENQELNAHNQELNNRLAAEITKMRSMASEDGDSGVGMQGKELYELEVMLRVKESEVQYLKQEINSLKDELQAAQRDKKYATDKYKDIYTELSIVKAKAERDLGRLRDQLQLAHEALGGPSLEEVERGGYDIMKSKSNPDILKMAAAAAKRSERTLRSKVC
uniref:Myosin phosphatase Rho interacting protein n=1 Tax=Gadus morhua TaxID=8049 RepID=A0A8C5B399_GADMO